MILSILFTLFLVFFYLTSHFQRIDSIPIGFESIIIISFSFYFFYERIRTQLIVIIYNDYRFWILIGMILYLAGSFFIYIYGEQLDNAAWKKFRSLTLVFYILRSVFFSISIFIYKKFPINKIQTQPKEIPNLDMY